MSFAIEARLMREEARHELGRRQSFSKRNFHVALHLRVRRVEIRTIVYPLNSGETRAASNPTTNQFRLTEKKGGVLLSCAEKCQLFPSRAEN